MAYDEAIQPSGDVGAFDDLDLSGSISTAISDLTDWMTTHGWTDLGGGVLESTPSPLGDQLSLYLYESASHLFCELTANGQVFPAQGMNACHFRAFVNPYQFAFRRRSDSPIPGADGTDYGDYLLGSALCVPAAYVATDLTIASFSDDGVAPLVIETSAAHGFKVGSVFWLSGGSPSTLDGRWYVETVVSPTEIQFTSTRGGSAYIGDGTASAADMYTRGVKSACVQFRGGSIAHLPYVPASATLATDAFVNGELMSGSMTGRAEALSAMFPAVNIRDGGIGRNLTGFVIRHAPYVALALQDDEECRVAGILWDGFVELRNRPFEYPVSVEDDLYTCWLDVLPGARPLVDCSLFLKYLEG